jgi:hypothetical protein
MTLCKISPNKTILKPIDYAYDLHIKDLRLDQRLLYLACVDKVTHKLFLRTLFYSISTIKYGTRTVIIKS